MSFDRGKAIMEHVDLLYKGAPEEYRTPQLEQ